MRRLLLLLAVAALAVISLPASLASASSGTLVITTDVTLTEDHLGSVVIAADNVTLDCAGHRVVDPGGYADGITVENRNGVTVKNCTVTGFDDAGFEIILANGNRFLNDRAVGNTYWGFRTSGDGNRFEGNTASENGVGYWVHQAAGNEFSGNTASSNLYQGFGGWRATDTRWADNVAAGNINMHGFALYDSDANRLAGNTSSGNGGQGFLLDDSSTQNTLAANRASNHVAGAGFAVWSSPGNALVANRAADNEVGYHLGFGSMRNVLVGNTATDNTEIGFWLAGASRNILTLNTATGNGTSGTWQWLPSGFLIDSWGDYPADNNVLTGNVANGNSLGFALAGHDEDLAPVSGNVFRSNTANNNTWYGFGAWRATGNTWQDNTANDNGHWGFALFDPCLTNTLTGNVGRRNGELDAYDEDIPMLNTWTNNKFAKTSPNGL